MAGIGLHVANPDRTDKTKANGATLGVPSWPSDGKESCIRHAIVKTSIANANRLGLLPYTLAYGSHPQWSTVSLERSKDAFNILGGAPTPAEGDTKI